MNILKEIILNQLIKIPFVKTMAKKTHSTGINNNEIVVEDKYNHFTQWVDVKAKSILEIGPGQTLEVIERARINGAAKVVAIDLEQYINSAILSEKEIEFYKYDGTALPFVDESFDIIWSNSVYEHIRYPEITVSETFRILKKGGIVIHDIDLVDHFWYSSKVDSDILNCLKYPQWLWNAIVWNRSNYVNRLRASNWIELHRKNGFIIKDIINLQSTYIDKNYTSLKYLQQYNKEDISIIAITIVATK
jgi:SAM-dependent methyltransferase